MIDSFRFGRPWLSSSIRGLWTQSPLVTSSVTRTKRLFRSLARSERISSQMIRSPNLLAPLLSSPLPGGTLWVNRKVASSFTRFRIAGKFEPRVAPLIRGNRSSEVLSG